MNSDAIVVLTTAPSSEEAENLARKIIEAKLAACVQVLPKMKSFYFWENQIQPDSEHLLLIKTLGEKYDELEKFIRANHSYDVPEIVALAAERVSESYLDWMKDYLG
jgi:periplasmic divalent cation tolerance protein